MCSWAKTSSGLDKVIDGQPLMEVLLYKHRKSGVTTLPGNFVDADEQLPHGLTQELTEAIVAYAVCHGI